LGEKEQAMAEKKTSALTGSTVMLLVGAVALAGAVYWVVFLGRGAEAPVAGSEADPDDAPAAVVDAVVAPEEVVQDESAPDVVVQQESAQEVVQEDLVAEAEPEAVAEPDGEDVLAEQDNEDVTAEPGGELAEADPEGEAETEAEAEPEPEVAETPVETPVGPSFDVVRIDPQGAAVIAGNAAPGAEVILLADGVEVGRATADLTGKFVALFDMPPSDAPRSLSAQMSVEGGAVVASAGTVLIAPVRPVVVAEAEPEVAPEVASEAEPVTEPVTEIAEADAAAEPAPDVAPEVVAEVEPEVEPEVVAVDVTPDVTAPQELESLTPESPTIVLADESGVRVLQGAAQPEVPSQSPQVVANLVIDTITYDTSGDVALSGRGQGASFARVYLDGKPVQTVQIAPDGTWRTPLPDVDAGVYRLRIDELDEQGTVTSRVETPFQREEPEIVAEAAGRANVVTVQKGFTLWAIAEDRFGSGIEYVRVYEANRDLIRDPDLIYPGQVFAIPEG
jgi:nucleoid-associated protein YgaU